MKRDEGVELARLCRLTAELVRQVGDSRWSGMTWREEAPPRPAGAAEPEAPAVPADPATAAVPADLDGLRGRVAQCRRCPLHQGRRNTVFGEGDPGAGLMFIGEAPGAEEDRQGRPFVGAAGRLLDRIIGAMGLRREQVFIANVIKCRPPGNRNPVPEEIACCLPYLHGQIDLIRPRAIVALGKFSSQSLLGSGESISRLRGRFHEYRGIRLMPTFHPSYLLRNPDDKTLVWQDMQQVMAHLGLPPPKGTE